MLVDPFRLLKKDVRKPRKKYLRNLCGVLNPSTYMCWPQAISVNMCTILGPDPLLELKNVPQTIGCPKVRVEIFTLARGARACIESTRFIIMTRLARVLTEIYYNVY